MNRILTGTDKAIEEGFNDYRERLMHLPNILALRGAKKLPRWNGETTDQDPVQARVDFGRWLADCECAGAEYVDADEPLFFCFSCGNKEHKGMARRVIFPADKDGIEAALLERKVIERRGDTESQKAMLSRAEGLPRSWSPGEKVDELRLQQKSVLIALKRSKVK